MRTSAQALDGDAGFDPAAAKALLRELGRPSAPPRPAPRSSPPVAVPPGLFLPERASRRAAAGRTRAAVIVAVAAPLAIGLGLAYWSTTSKPPSSAPSTSAAAPASAPAPVAPAPNAPVPEPLAKTVAEPRRVIDAYAVTTPVPAQRSAARDAALAEAKTAELNAIQARAGFEVSRAPEVSAPAEKPAAEVSSAGVLDPAPSATRPADAVAD